MKALVPNRFLFDFEFPLHYRAKTPRITGALADWRDEHLLPDLGELDGATSFGQVWACWNETGIAIACRVTGKRRRPQCSAKSFWEGDNLRLCTDMRDTRNIKRASRHCQQFYFLPTSGGKQAAAPVAGVNAIQRARAAASADSAAAIAVAARIAANGYQLEGHIPAAALAGFEPQEHPRIGFYYMLEDLELGHQHLTVGDDLYWHIDPSTWPTAVLVR